MKKALLASTALVGAALLSAPAQAGTVGSGDNMEVKLSGVMYFQAHWLDEDTSAGFGRGYDFDVPETELTIDASNTADNGITYGVSIEIESNTDASTNADEVWAFVSGDFGRLEMGDQDDATNRMLVGAYQTNKGASGPFGSLLGIQPVFHNANGPTGVGGLQRILLDRTDWQAGTSNDRTKIIYFSPRFSGFQVGASWTPDGSSTANGASFGERDDDGGFENMLGLGLNYTGKFDDVGLSVSALYEHADVEATGNGAINDGEGVEVFYVGAKVDFAGFSVGGNWRDNGDTGLTGTQTAAGADAGTYWAVGVGYQQGPWGIGGWYSLGEADTSSTVEISIARWGIGANYAVAPGWVVKADYNNNRIEQSGSADRDQQAFILTNQFNF